MWTPSLLNKTLRRIFFKNYNFFVMSVLAVCISVPYACSAGQRVSDLLELLVGYEPEEGAGKETQVP